MARKKSLVFETQKRSNRGNTQKFWLILIASVIAILSISLVAILKNSDYNIDTAFGIEKETETSELTSEAPTVVFEAERTFLIWCAESDREGIRFMNIVRVSMPDCKVTVCAVDPYSAPDTIGGGETPASIYLKSGEKALVSSVEKAYDLDIDRYICASETQFKSFINYFSGIDITVPEQINHKSDSLSLVLIKGKHNLKGDTLFKYMLYLNTIGENGKRRQSAVMLEIIEGIFNPSNLGKRGRIFNRIANNMTTDISIVDFSSEENGIVALMENGVLQAETVESPEELH
ncbi:MAG: LCP family protein [Clostridia bacterium]|nr:LCP family protein [Clostridia bacterium]